MVAAHGHNGLVREEHGSSKRHQRSKPVHLACAKDRSDRRHLRAAARDARHVEREQLPWATALSVLVRAGIAERRGDIERATALLSDAISRLEDCQMRLWWAAAVRRKGELIGGIEGQALTEVADAWMQNQGVTQPARMARALAP